MDSTLNRKLFKGLFLLICLSTMTLGCIDSNPEEQSGFKELKRGQAIGLINGEEIDPLYTDVSFRTDFHFDSLYQVVVTTYNHNFFLRNVIFIKSINADTELSDFVEYDVHVLQSSPHSSIGTHLLDGDVAGFSYSMVVGHPKNEFKILEFSEDRIVCKLSAVYEIRLTEWSADTSIFHTDNTLIFEDMLIMAHRDD